MLLTLLYVFLFSLVIGSFLNVVIYRLPILLEKQNWFHCHAFCSSKKLDVIPTIPEHHQSYFNLSLPPSHCPQCKTTIAFYDNIPLISYLILKRRCRVCGEQISFQYPLVELLSGAIGVISIGLFGLTLTGLGVALLGWGLLCLSAIDLRHQILPDNLTLPFLWLGLIFNLFNIYITTSQAIIGAIAGYLFLWIVYWIFKLISKKEAMGYGDFKLLALLGAWMGWQMLPFVILFASLLGATCGIIYITIYKKSTQTPIPFGPFLSLSGWGVFVWMIATQSNLTLII